MSEIAETIVRIASLLAAIGALITGFVAVYKVFDNNKRQNAAIESMHEEQTIICYAVQGCLQGLIEQGCDGPCKESLAMLQKHLNKKAHVPNL